MLSKTLFLVNIFSEMRVAVCVFELELLAYLKGFKEETLEEDLAFRKDSRLRLQAEP